LYLATRHGHLGSIRLLSEKGNKDPPRALVIILYKAYARGYLDIVQFVLSCSRIKESSHASTLVIRDSLTLENINTRNENNYILL